MILESDYCKILHRSEERPTVIAFSSINTPRGQFKPYKIVAECNSNIIFINDKRNSWYQEGVESVSPLTEEAAEQLVEHGRSIGNGKVITFGTSMGAYGAALFAALGNADGCLGFGVETPLGLEFSRSQLGIHSTVKIRFPSLREQILKANNSCMYVFYASETDEVDLFSLNSLKDISQVVAFTIRGMDHPGVQLFDLDNSITSRIDNFAANLSMPEGYKQNGQILNYNDLIADLWQSFKYKKTSGGIEKWVLAAQKITYDWPFIPLAHLRLGEAFYKNRDIENAEKCWLRAIKICPYSFEAMTKLGSLYRRKGYVKKALSILEEAVALNNYNAYGFHALGLTYFDQKDYMNAEINLRRARHLNRGNIGFKKSLAEFLEFASVRNDNEAKALRAEIKESK